METNVIKTKFRDRLTAVNEKWQICQNGKTVLCGDGLSVRMIFRNLCRMNFSGKEYEHYISFPLFNGFETGKIELLCDEEVILTGSIEV
jgi:hypothetical protein